MALRRFYWPDSVELLTESLLVRGDLFHHIRDVCRFGAGDQFEILPGDGRALLYQVTSVGGRDLQAQRISARTLPPPARPAVTLALSVPKLPKVDWIVEKASELGVDEIRPFTSDHSFLRDAREIKENRLERWRKLSMGATQQSGRGDVMQICPASSLQDLWREWEAANRRERIVGLFPFEGEAQMGLRRALHDLKAVDPDRIWVFVGSEGGFSQREVAIFGEKGMQAVSMGHQILRVETACLALVSVIKYEVGALE